MTRAFLALLLAAATPALPTVLWAQTPPPTPGQIVAQQQINLNQFQAQLQAEQLDQLQRLNTAALSSPNPNVQVQALARRQQIQQQIDQNTALQQQMRRPGSNPSDITSQLQQHQAQIQQLQPQPATP